MFYVIVIWGDLMNTYGSRIKAARESANLTQEGLGQKLGVTGVTIMRYEKNQREPRQDQFKRLAAALNVDVNWLMNGYTLAQRDQDQKDYMSKRYKDIEAQVDGSIRVHVSPEQREYSRLMKKQTDGTITEEELQRLTDLHSRLPSIQESLVKLGDILNRLGQCMVKLNDEGQHKVEDYAQDLARIPEYQATSAPQSPPSPQVSTDTTPAPEGAEGPQEGK